MSSSRLSKVVITGIGMVTPLGNDPAEVLREIQVGHCAAASPRGFDAGVFACPVCAQVKDFDPQRYVSETKMTRLMNRDAQFAVAAARMALADAGVASGRTYQPEEIALFGATGLAGLPLREVAPLIRVSADTNGEFDLTRFGQAGLKAVSPVLSFKILSNMPFCFVSINENIKGPNAIYTPWEGEGAQALEAGIRALQADDARCVLAGGCDVKTHELAFASLQQLGLFDSWKRSGTSPGGRSPAGAPASSSLPEPAGRNPGAGGVEAVLPGEGAVFLVLETERDASARGADIYGCLNGISIRSHFRGREMSQTRAEVLSRLHAREVKALVSSAEGDEVGDLQERSLLDAVGISAGVTICPKKHVGNLFAGAALLQIAMGAVLADAGATSVLVNCFGHGSTQAAFVLEPAGTGPPRGRRSES